MAGYALLNNAAVRDLASLVLKENVVQNIMVIPYRSADFRYTEDMNARSVTVNRPKLVSGGRTIGDATNGGFFNDLQAGAESDLYEIALTNVFDKTIKIAQVQDDMSGATALRGQLMNVPRAIARFTNATYFATLLANNIDKAVVATSAGGVVSYAVSGEYATEIVENTTEGAMAGLASALISSRLKNQQSTVQAI